MAKRYFVSDKLLKMYFNLETTPEQTLYVLEAINTDPAVQEKYMAMEREEARKDRTGKFLPMEKMAAAGEDNLCDVLCEEFILKKYDVVPGIQERFDVAERNTWVQSSGTPLYNIGRILEANGMTVARRYDCSLSDIEEAIKKRIKVIVVVDYDVLLGNDSKGVFHAMVCVNYGDYILDIFDPALGEIVHYSTNRFEEAWAASRNYMVSATTDKMVYNPQPLPLDDVDLDLELMDLVEAIAENLHDIWGVTRKKQGYVYGAVSDDSKEPRTNKYFLPYCDLDEKGKSLDRDTAIAALKMAKKLGFYVSRPGEYKCSHCGGAVSFDMAYCPTCGHKLSFDDFFPKGE